MKFSENSSQAANYLRLAVPKMVKHKIVPNPLNYTLWYSYYSNSYSNLKQELDDTILKYGTCPQIIGEELFLKHIAYLDGANEKELGQIQKSFDHLVNDLSNSIDTNTLKSKSYSSAVQNSLAQLESVSSSSDLKRVATQLASETNTICQSNLVFQQQIAAARQEIDSLKQELESSKREATTDPLTGLFNRRVFESIYREFAINNSGDEISLIIMDVDHFKKFNDTHGHLMGDQVLQVIGKLLQKYCNKPYFPVRYGGEEFAILCPTIPLERAFSLAENVRSKLSSVSLTNKRTGEKVAPITASFGVTHKQDQESISELIEKADKALYMAKNAGRNQVQMAF